jgi:hypothetical protein
LAPASTRDGADARPIPELAPVMTMVSPARDRFSIAMM